MEAGSTWVAAVRAVVSTSDSGGSTLKRWGAWAVAAAVTLPQDSGALESRLAAVEKLIAGQAEQISFLRSSLASLREAHFANAPAAAAAEDTETETAAAVETLVVDQNAKPPRALKLAMAAAHALA